LAAAHCGLTLRLLLCLTSTIPSIEFYSFSHEAARLDYQLLCCVFVEASLLSQPYMTFRLA
jgi:hypothetical protein